jgi:hypothetical protein
MHVPPAPLPATFHVFSLEARQLESGAPMSAGRHFLEAGATDKHRPHAEDEAWDAMSARA